MTTAMQDSPGHESAGTKTYLRIDDLTKNFGAFTALRDVSLEIYEGEFVCFLGPSGCGKTTLLRCIAGLDYQTAGRIAQGGTDISALPPSERDFGIVFQSYALFPNLTVQKNIAYGLENRKVGKADTERKVAELLELVGLEGQGPKYPAQLSGGQQQRVALARALATSPGLLLLDEPLSALDARVRVHLRHEIRQLQERLGVTTIMVTHDQEEALTMADRIVVMNHGVIEQIGTPTEVYGTPKTAFVADFVGTMNFMPGTAAGAGRVRLGTVELNCAAMNGISEGTPVTVAVRPEDFVVRCTDGANGNAFEAEIDDMEFLGSFYRAELKVPGMGESRIVVDLSVNAVRDLELAGGRSLPVAVPSDHILVFPAD